ncbi:MAG: hypothetical protein NTW87_19240 [Planctomycetota bacterium]|nr:hypothetical protein [Planctomycetota bacterium]
MEAKAEDKRARPFLTVTDLLITVGFVAFVLLALTTGLLSPPHIVGRDRAIINGLVLALEKYRDDFLVYPPDTVPTSKGGEVLYHFLCRNLSSGALTYGPYVAMPVVDRDGDGFPEIPPSSGLGDLEYKVLLAPDGKQRGCVIISPGPDGLLGGTVDPRKGFIPDETILNKDGQPAYEDNITR